MVEAGRAPLSSNGLSVIQLPQTTEAGQSLVTMLMHDSGQWICDDGLPLTYEASKGVNLAQALGSMLTYCRRYGYMNITGIVADDATEDDGTKAGPPNQKPPEPRIRPELRKQAGDLADALKDSNDPGWISDQISKNEDLLAELGKADPAWRQRLESIATTRIEELNLGA